MPIKKVRLNTTLKLLRKHGACNAGYKSVLTYVGVDYPDNKPISLLTILESNCLDHFFWAWRATTKKEKQVKRMILHHIVKSVQPLYENKYPNSTVIKDVLKVLATGRNLKRAADAAYAAYDAAYAANAADAAYAAYAAYDAAYAAANAANAAYAAYAAADAADAAYAAYDAAYAANASYAAYAAADAARKAEQEKQITIIKRYLK